jgi:hypothetical protein
MSDEMVDTKLPNVTLSAEYLQALRKAAGLLIDPKTAEVMWWHADTCDPYGDYEPDDEHACIGREYFARAPGMEIWINFCDIPEATRDTLWGMYRSKLRFPAGVFDVDTMVSPH